MSVSEFSGAGTGHLPLRWFDLPALQPVSDFAGRAAIIVWSSSATFAGGIHGALYVYPSYPRAVVMFACPRSYFRIAPLSAARLSARSASVIVTTTLAADGAGFGCVCANNPAAIAWRT